MPKTRNGYLSTSAIARALDIERDVLFSYLESINLLVKNTSTNSYELTEQGQIKGGKYQSSTGESRWIIWPDKIINDEIFNGLERFAIENTDQSTKQVSMNVWKLDVLKELQLLISEGKTVEEISSVLDIDEIDIKRKIDSLPRVRKKYNSMHPSELINNELDTSLTNEKIISYLAQGINPMTGEVLPNDSFLNAPEVIRALFVAKEAMLQHKNIVKMPKREKKTKEEKQNENITNGMPKNAGLPWTDELKLELADKFKENRSVSLLAEIFERTKGSIIAQLVKQELISHEEKYLYK